MLARLGNARRFDLPRPLKGRPDCNFSFSGLKTAVREIVQAQPALTDDIRADVCASFELAVVETVADRTRRAMALFREACPEAMSPALVIAGGVAANARLRAMFGEVAEQNGFALEVPPFHLCTDNAAMIAWQGRSALRSAFRTNFIFAARARWPLDTVSAPVVGRGRLGGRRHEQENLGSGRWRLGIGTVQVARLAGHDVCVWSRKSKDMRLAREADAVMCAGTGGAAGVDGSTGACHRERDHCRKGH